MEKEKGARKKANAFPASSRISRISKKFASCTRISSAYSYIFLFLCLRLVERCDLVFVHIFHDKIINFVSNIISIEPQKLQLIVYELLF